MHLPCILYPTYSTLHTSHTLPYPTCPIHSPQPHPTPFYIPTVPPTNLPIYPMPLPHTSQTPIPLYLPLLHALHTPHTPAHAPHPCPMHHPTYPRHTPGSLYPLYAPHPCAHWVSRGLCPGSPLYFYIPHVPCTPIFLHMMAQEPQELLSGDFFDFPPFPV